jgi:hypothetical protein
VEVQGPHEAAWVFRGVFVIVVVVFDERCDVNDW